MERIKSWFMNDDGVGPVRLALRWSVAMFAANAAIIVVLLPL